MGLDKMELDEAHWLALAKTWGVYILHCADGTLYTGISNRMAVRLAYHRAGKASRYTRTRLPVLLVYWEDQPDRSAASRRELALKRLSRHQKWLLINGKERGSIELAPNGQCSADERSDPVQFL